MITKANEIEKFLEDYLNSGITDLSKIYDMIEEQTNFPRPTIRRVAREYRIRLEEHCKILNSNCVNLLVH